MAWNPGFSVPVSNPVEESQGGGDGGSGSSTPSWGPTVIVDSPRSLQPSDIGKVLLIAADFDFDDAVGAVGDTILVIATPGDYTLTGSELMQDSGTFIALKLDFLGTETWLSLNVGQDAANVLTSPDGSVSGVVRLTEAEFQDLVDNEEVNPSIYYIRIQPV